MAENGKIYGVQPKVEVTEQVQTERYNEIFLLVTRNKKTMIAIGKSIVSNKTFKSVKEAKTYIDQKPWELLINVICLITDTAKTVKTEEKENQ